MTQPLTCFKYRSGSAALCCLEKGRLYFAAPNQLNDTLEAKYDHGLSEDFVKVMTETYSEISEHRGGSALEINQHSMTEIAEVYARECQNLQVFTEQIGIFSAASRANDQAMWAYYANNASGVCFELEWSHDVANRYQIWATDVEYYNGERIHNRAEDWRTVFLELAQQHPSACLDKLHQLSLTEPVRRKWGILTSSRAVSIKHTDWAHEKEIRLLAPKSDALPVLKEVLKRVHFVRTDGEQWGEIMQLLHAHYPSVEPVQWQFSHGKLTAAQTPMEFRLIKI